MLNNLKFVLFGAMALTLSSSALAQQDDAEEDADAVNVILHTNLGDITLELYPEQSPVTVDNFLAYVRDGFYDGTIFHRVIDGFMIQGGGYTQDLQRKPTRDPIENESDNGLSNEAGTIAMARLPQPDTATAQFFINVADNARLDYQEREGAVRWGYTVFGRVTDGMDVVNQIKGVQTGAMGPFQRDVPLTPVVIESAEVVEEPPAQ